MKLYYQVLVRYLLHFLVFAFLLLLVFVPVWWYAFNFYKNNELSYMADKMKAGIGAIDSSIIVVNNTIGALVNNSQFQAFRRAVMQEESQDPSVNPNLLIELKAMLNTQLSSNSLFADAGILFSRNICLSRYRVFYFPGLYSFYGKFFSAEGLTQDEWLKIVSEKTPIIPVLSYNSVDFGIYEGIAFSKQWSYGDYPGENVIFAIMPVGQIILLIADKKVAAQGTISIYDQNGELLYTKGAEMRGKQYTITALSQVSGMRFEIGIPDSILKDKMRIIRNLLVFFLVFTGIIVFSLSLIFAWQNTKPILSFLKTIDSTNSVRSEYEKIKSNLHLSPFRSFRQLFSDIGASISLVDGKLEYSFGIIENETRLLKIHTVDKIKEALENGNEETVHIILREIASALPDPDDPYISNLIVNMLLNLIEELKKNYPRILSDLEVPLCTPGKQKEFLLDFLAGCFKNIDKKLQWYRKENLTSLEQSILDFVNEHLYDHGLYITMISEQFGISGPTLQKLIKKVSGQTFQAYVENMRLTRARRILTSTGKTATETAALCGFSNINTFSRVFKQRFGFSPGRFREFETKNPESSS
jgi:AraC-like DNA-binding protein